MMYRIAAIVTLLCLYPCLTGQEKVSNEELAYYKELNDLESGLLDYKDSDNDLMLKLIQLKVINESRKQYRVPPVNLDILASRVANMACLEAAEGDYISHWNRRGEKPYHRYAFAGGHDHISENVAGESYSGSYEQNNRTRLDLMKKYHEIFMAEKAPNNGHKLNIMEKTHNYVGIGFCLGENVFRYNEEFIDRYYEFIDVPDEVNANEEFTITLKTMEGYYLCYVVAYWEKELRSMTNSYLQRTGSYPDYTDRTELEIGPWQISKYKEANQYVIKMNFHRPGLYYVQIYQDDKDHSQSRSFTSKGKIQASGIVIRVV
ncbi:MAG TPA: CAP domain-containing protein [Bacteroidales bacterium]|nr:CAP domain-containing protein [Bacteroidales bacterium]